jgi:hypothetical protein
MTTDLYGRWLRAIPTRGGVGALDTPIPVESPVRLVREVSVGAKGCETASGRTQGRGIPTAIRSSDVSISIETTLDSSQELHDWCVVQLLEQLVKSG